MSIKRLLVLSFLALSIFLVGNTEVFAASKIITGKNYNTIDNTAWDYRVNEDYAYVRKGSASGSVQDTVYLGTEMEVIKTVNSSANGCSAGKYYQVKYFYQDSARTKYKTGFICKTYVDKYTEVTKNDTAYCNTLKKQGFPESYCPYLSYLHSKHPNWVFKAENAGVTFDKAAKGEAGRNYTQMKNGGYIASDSIAEAGGWRVASNQYVGFMIDPRNYLNEKNIFAFENLSYDAYTQTLPTVQSVFKGTWLATNAKSKKFINAGSLKKVSPVHLASRAKQEGMTNKSYSAVSGKVSTKWQVSSNAYVCATKVKVNTKNKTIKVKKKKTKIYVRSGAGNNYGKLKYPNGKYITLTTNDSLSFVTTTKYKSKKGCKKGWYRVRVNKSLKHVYNFYNIGSYGSNPVVRGLATAAGYVDDEDGTPWNTYNKAIKNGAGFIAGGYITRGQDTLFYQKFNVGPRNYFPKYTHQYMTNILAPASEGLSTYRSYSSMLNKPYTFKIPVYQSMPNNPTSHPLAK